LTTILITGANGFIGSHLLNILIKNSNYNIIAAYRKKKNNIPNKKNIKLIKIDLQDKKINWFNELEKPDILIHLAWDFLDNFKSSKHKTDLLKFHYLFLANLINNGLKNLISAGTCLEYGKVNGELSENLYPKPILPYARAKNQLRIKLQNLQKKNKYNLTWLRLFYIYGKGSNSRIYNDLIKSIKNKNKFFNMSKGDQIRDFIDISKLCEYIYKIIENKNNNGIVNICSGNPIVLKDLVNEWIKERKSSIVPNYGYFKYNEYEARSFWGSSRKLNKIISK